MGGQIRLEVDREGNRGIRSAYHDDACGAMFVMEF